MRVLVLNCGSSSLKFQLIETSRQQIDDDADRVLARGLVERIGSQDAKIGFQITGADKEETTAPVKDAAQAIAIAFDKLAGAGDLERD